jgi:hypothetical protein
MLVSTEVGSCGRADITDKVNHAVITDNSDQVNDASIADEVIMQSSLMRPSSSHH